MNECNIKIENLTLKYDLHYTSGGTLKDFLIKKLSFARKVKGIAKPTSFNALDNINLEIAHGDRVAIIGLNGSGKSTLLKVISGILKPTKGNIGVKGDIQPLIEIGAGFNPDFSGRENIYLNGAMLGFSKEEIKAKEQDIIDFSELEKFIDIPVKYYSSGMSVRLAFTIATMIRPEILLMDEMISAGDLSFIDKAKKRIQEILNVAKILVLVSHDLELVKTLAARTIVLSAGKIVFDGPTEDAITFYKKQVIKREGLFVESQPIDVDCTQGDGFIKILNAKCEVGENNSVKFVVEFETNKPFMEFFVNLTILKSTNTIATHFRNDFSGIDFVNYPAGMHKATIMVPYFPFKEGDYKYYFRLVGLNEEQMSILDSTAYSFNVDNGLKSDCLIEHHWEVMY